MEVLRTGKVAFPRIIEDIGNAKKSIFINMFIWRNDNIGCAMARAVLDAANRGVKIEIVKDRYGAICELCEENRKSFFHRESTLTEILKSSFMNFAYMRNQPAQNKFIEEDNGELLEHLLSHPNILFKEEMRFDHSKFYLIDDEILYVGGINIEDKENGCDFFNRSYRDYMVRITNKKLIGDFKRLRKNPSLSLNSPFCVNIKSSNEAPLFYMERHYLDFINNSEKELTIVMAYLSPMPKIMDAIINASNRGVKVKILTSIHSNFQTDLNKKVLNILLSRSNGNIEIYLTPHMTHTKLLMNEKAISFGSTNLTKKSFHQLDELNLVLDRHEDFENCINLDFSEAEKANEKLLRYNKHWAFCEGLLA